MVGTYLHLLIPESLNCYAYPYTSFIKGSLTTTIVISILTLVPFSSVTASYTMYCAFDILGLRPFAHPLIFSILKFDALHA